MNEVKIVCIGSAAQDVFLSGKVFTPECEEGICHQHLRLGDKYAVDELIFATGGNAMNASVTFARQGIDTSFVGLVGDDPAGQSVLHALDAESVHTNNVVVDRKYATSYSVILLAPNGERTILNHHGEPLSSRPRLVSQATLSKTDWVYVSSVGSMDMLREIILRAEKAGARIAFNPATFELGHLQECADLFAHIDLLALNKEEAQQFVHGGTTQQLAAELAKSVEYVLVSDGPRGAVATDGHELLTAGLYEDVPVIDRTGAGDSFTSGFISQIALGKDLATALTFASANSTSVVGQVGATAGILRRGAKIHDMPIKSEPLNT